MSVAPAREGIYGRPYGGFITFIAVLKRPKLRAAGAALRPVTHGHIYSDANTHPILDTPLEDPESYHLSSSIELAEGLDDPVLICHGIVDSTVPYQGSVRLAQRPIKLEKTDWEWARNSVEGHSFTKPSS